MTRILACVDGSVYVDSVVDHAAWAAGRMGLPIELLQVLGRREATASDRSGRIVAGARRRLLEELAEVDAERARLLQKEARLVLEDAKQRLEAAGVAGMGATGQSFGWINASFHADEAHFRLRQAGMEAWRRIEGVSVDWQGCLCWEHQGAALEAQVRA